MVQVRRRISRPVTRNRYDPIVPSVLLQRTGVVFLVVAAALVSCDNDTDAVFASPSTSGAGADAGAGGTGPVGGGGKGGGGGNGAHGGTSTGGGSGGGSGGCGSVDPCDGSDNDCNGLLDDAARMWNFDAGPDVWLLEGTAYHDGTAKDIVLTTATTYSQGKIWLPTPLMVSSLTLTFDFWMGQGTSPAGDGVFVIFAKSMADAFKNSYVVIFDTYDNAGEGENSVRLFRYKDGIGSVVATYSAVPCLDCATWMTAEIKVVNGTFGVSVGGTTYLSVIAPGFNVGAQHRIGIMGATGEATNWHRIDDVKLKGEFVSCVP